MTWTIREAETLPRALFTFEIYATILGAFPPAGTTGNTITNTQQEGSLSEVRVKAGVERISTV